MNVQETLRRVQQASSSNELLDLRNQVQSHLTHIMGDFNRSHELDAYRSVLHAIDQKLAGI